VAIAVTSFLTTGAQQKEFLRYRLFREEFVATFFYTTPRLITAITQTHHSATSSPAKVRLNTDSPFGHVLTSYSQTHHSATTSPAKVRQHRLTIRPRPHQLQSHSTHTHHSATASPATVTLNSYCVSKCLNSLTKTLHIILCSIPLCCTNKID
jgi:hypothetical protein